MRLKAHYTTRNPFKYSFAYMGVGNAPRIGVVDLQLAHTSVQNVLKWDMCSYVYSYVCIWFGGCNYYHKLLWHIHTRLCDGGTCVVSALSVFQRRICDHYGVCAIVLHAAK